MKQTIRQLRWLARDMGITVQELLRRRSERDDMAAYVDSDRCVHIKPRLYVDPAIPDSWAPVYGTKR